jgi:hypothetical protein
MLAGATKPRTTAVLFLPGIQEKANEKEPHPAAFPHRFATSVNSVTLAARARVSCTANFRRRPRSLFLAVQIRAAADCMAEQR